MYLSVVIPCFNELVNLQKGVLDKIEHYLGKKGINYEVIVVDDGSTDGSIAFIEQFCRENSHFTLIKNPHMGKAGTVTTGMLAASGAYVLFTDMDQATPIEELDKLLPFFKKNIAVVIGSRTTKRRGAPFTRIIMAHSAILLRKLLVGLPFISDTQCGFKAFRGDVAEKLFTKILSLHNGFSEISGSAVTAGFDVELLFLASKMGYEIKEIPVDWLYVETRRVSPMKDSIDGLIDFLQIRYNIMKGRYN